jgi:membrane protease YdiL (CAAX protease family)
MIAALHAMLLSAWAQVQPTTQPTGPMRETLDKPMVALLAVGVLVLGLWGALRLRHPRKLSLQAAPGRRNQLHPLHILPVFVVWFALAALLNELLRIGGLAQPHRMILASLLGQLPALAACLIVGRWGFPLGLRRGMGLCVRHWGFDLLRGVMGYLGVFPVCIGLVLAMQAVLPDRLQQPHALLNWFAEVSVVWQGLIFISAAVLAPLLEELLFRGLVQSMLRRYLGPWSAVLVASGLFALTHRELQNIPALFALGVVLGYNYERTGRLTPPIVIHALFNGMILLLAMLG